MQATEEFWTAMVFGVLCPFLTCKEFRNHQHAICPECGAVRFGNLSCRQCRLAHELKLETVKLETEAA